MLQVDDYKNDPNSPSTYSGSMDSFRKILAADGVKGLYKGFGPAMARNVPANTACFLAYEMSMSALGWLISSVLVSSDFFPLLLIHVNLS